MSVETNHSNDKAPSRNGKSPTTNQEEASLKQRRLDLVFNLVQSRQQLMRQMSERRRDIDKECDYPITGEITPWTFQELFDREPIPNRVVKCIALESWQVSPEVYDDEDEKVTTPFEQAWKDVGKTLRGGQSWYGDEVGSPVWDALLKADIVSGIGAWGLIVLGIDDGLSLDNPLEGVLDPSILPDQMLTPYDPYSGVASWGVAVPPDSSVQDASTSVGHIPEVDVQVKVGTGTSPTKTPPSTKTSTKDTSQDIPYSSQETKGAAKGSKPTRKLIYLRVFKQASVQISRYDSNPASPRRGQPTEYLVTLSDPNSSLGGGAGQLSQTVTVHWTRTVHVADNTIDNEWCGTPRMLPVLNRLLDLRKLYAGSAEMYWLGALPGWAFSTHPQLGGDVEIVQSDIREMMEDYSNGFQRWLTLEGMNPVSLAPQVVDPSPQINICLEAIAIQIGVPVPVLKGYEIGEQASTNNDSDWKGRLTHRENFYVSPRIIAPLVDRLIACGVLPTPKDGSYFIKWPDLTTKSDEDKAALGLQKAQTIAAFVTANGETALPLFWFLTTVLDYTQDEAKTIIEEATKVQEEQQAKEAEQGLAQQQASHEQKLQQDKEKIAAGTMVPPAIPGVGKGTGGFTPKKANPFPPSPSVNYSPDQPRESNGEFGSSGASTSSQGKGVIQSIKGLGTKAGHYEHVAKEYMTSTVESNVSKLPPRIQAAVRAVMFVGKKLTQAAFASYTAGQAFAERVAKERGATEEQAKTLRNVLAASDIALAKPIAVGTASTGIGSALTVATGLIPAATAGYLAYSTARNPLATYRAARDIIRKGVGSLATPSRGDSMADKFAIPTRNEDGSEVVMILNVSEEDYLKIGHAVADHEYSEWYVALLLASLAETQDVDEAIEGTDSAFEQVPEDPSDDENYDVGYNRDGSDLLDPTTNLGYLSQRTHDGGTTDNVFCSTGEGGGVDPSCSKDQTKYTKGQAKQLTDQAREADRVADKTESPKDHLAAAIAHEAASKSYQYLKDKTTSDDARSKLSSQERFHTSYAESSRRKSGSEGDPKESRVAAPVSTPVPKPIPTKQVDTKVTSSVAEHLANTDRIVRTDEHLFKTNTLKLLGREKPKSEMSEDEIDEGMRLFKNSKLQEQAENYSAFGDGINTNLWSDKPAPYKPGTKVSHDGKSGWTVKFSNPEQYSIEKNSEKLMVSRESVKSEQPEKHREMERDVALKENALLVKAAQTKLDTPVTVFRAIDRGAFDAITKLGKDQAVEYKGFSSTSINPNAALQFSNTRLALLQIKAKTGFYISGAVSMDANELIQAPGVKYRRLGTSSETIKGKTYDVHVMEEV